jgi:hypothetical protein
MIKQSLLGGHSQRSQDPLLQFPFGNGMIFGSKYLARLNLASCKL